MQATFPFYSRFRPNPVYNADMSKVGRPPKRPQPLLGKNIAQAREVLGISQAELAERVGASQQVVAAWERKYDRLHSDNLVKLAQALNVTTDQLLGLKEPTTQPKAAGNTFEKRLQKKIQEIAQLGPNEKRQVMQHLDMVLENNRLKNQKAS